MGLAASQARFLGITARKSNIEYEGQQVNQQRTALADEVNSLYSKLLAIDVPVAPDSTEFYETNYSFEVKTSEEYNGDYLIKSYSKNPDGSYLLSTERTYEKNYSELTLLKNSNISTDEAGNFILNTTEGSFTLTPNAPNSANIVALINETEGREVFAEDTQLYYYEDSEGIFHYIDPEIVKDGQTNISSYTSEFKEVTENVVFESAQIQLDEKGRFESISLYDPDGNNICSDESVDTTRIYDKEGYDAALRDYTMSKEEYDRAIAELNSRTESLQEEDKVLELRLNQLDTEQSELQTELESVKKILEKNIENVFNTFS